MTILNINELVNDLDNLNPEKLYAFVRGMTTHLLELKEKLASEDGNVKAEALKEALELRESIDHEMNTLAQKLGVEREQMSKFIDVKDPNPAYQQVIEEIEELKGLFKR